MNDLDRALIARYLEGTCSPEERETVERWSASDTANAAELHDLRRTWTDAMRLPSSRRVDAMWAQLSSRMREPVPTAGVADDPSELEIHVRRQRAVRARTLPRRRRILGRRALFTSAATLVIIAGLAVFSHRRSVPAERSGPPHVYNTVRGERANIRLSDGSSLVLAPESRVTVPADFGQAARELMLEGEALFEVTHDTTLPFRVRAKEAMTEDVGTRFDVRAYSNEHVVTVVVTEGVVAFSRARDPQSTVTGRRTEGALLRRGELGRLDADGRISTARAVRLVRYIGWAHGRLVFARAPLPDVARAISRWYDLDVRVPDPALAARFVTAEFSTQSPSGMFDALAIALNAEIERDGRVVTLRPKP